MRIQQLLITIAIAGAPAVAMAHDVAKGPHGGQVIDDAGNHVEFTTKNDQIMLYLTDPADKPIDSAKATGRIVSQAGDKQTNLDLVSTVPNLMVAKLPSPLGKGAKVVISIKLADGHDVKARFVSP